MPALYGLTYRETARLIPPELTIEYLVRVFAR